MEPKMRKFRMPRLSATIGSLALVCLTGFSFFKSLIRHTRGTLGYGIIFILAVSLALISPFILTKNTS